MTEMPLQSIGAFLAHQTSRGVHSTSLRRKEITWQFQKRHPKQKLRRHVPNVRNKNPAWGALDSCLRPRDSAGIAHLPDRAFSLGEIRLIDARSRPRHQLVRRDAACAQDLSLAWSNWGSNISPRY